jgi:hypothetical protein
MNATVLIHRNCKTLAAVMEAINIVNQTQPYFRLHLSRVNWLPNDTKRRVSGGSNQEAHTQGICEEASSGGDPESDARRMV